MLSHTQKAKLRFLWHKIDTVYASKRRELSDLGLVGEDFTLDFLLAADPRGDFQIGCHTLQLLTDNDYLPILPPLCLTPNVVTAWTKFWTEDGADYETNLLCWCASEGRYHELPDLYKAREYLVSISPGRGSNETPLYNAASCGRLDRFPIENLEAHDLTSEIILQAAQRDQIKLVESLILPVNVDARILHRCLLTDQLPDVIIRSMTADKMLADAGCGQSPLATAASNGKLNRIDVEAFTNHYDQVRSQLFAGFEHSQKGRLLMDEIDSDLMFKIQNWINEIAVAKLTRVKNDAAPGIDGGSTSQVR